MNESPETTFSQFLHILAKRWWLFLLLPLVTLAAIAIIGYTAPDEYIAYERLQVIPSDAQLVTLFSRTPVLTSEQQIQAVQDDFYDTIRLPSVAWKTIADLQLNMSAEELIKRLETKEYSQFITVSIRMPEPELAQKVVTVHTQNAIEMLRRIRVNPSEVTMEFLEGQIQEQEKVLADAQAALQQFQLEHEVSKLSDEIAAAENERRTLAAERDRLSTEAARAEALAEQYQKLAQMNQDKADTLMASLTATVPITDTASITLTQDVPATTLEVMKQIQALNDLAAQEARKAQEQLALAAGHRAAMADYDRILNERQQDIIYLLGLQEEYQNLVNQVQQAQTTYDFLTEKANEARLKVAQGSSVGYLEVISPARVPSAPAPKHLWQIMLVGLLASLVIAMILAFILEALERHVLNK